MTLARKQVQSSIELQGGGCAQRRGSWMHRVPQQQRMPGNVKSLVWQVSPWWKEEQHRRGHICFLAAGEVPPQSHRHCTCKNADDLFIDLGEGELVL